MTAEKATPATELRRVRARNIDFSYFECGSGPLALCLHGFPDTAHSWLPLMERLAAAGYRCVAPFTRGYAPTQVPTDGCYQTATLAADAVALHEALGGDERAVIIGHDWGAPSAYGAAISAPDRWRRVVGMAVPPGPALGAAFLGNLDQLKRSWYMFFFQHPFADFVVGANDLAYIDMLWADWSPGFDSRGELELLKPSLRNPENLQAALGYYRATLGAGFNDPDLQAAQDLSGAIPSQPLLYLHGRTDGCMGIEVAEAAVAEFPTTATARFVDEVGHFLHLERPDDINALILDCLGPSV